VKRLVNKVAWISGATSGIGEATARLFVEEGGRVAVVGRRQRLAASIARDLGEDRAVASRCDVGIEDDVRRSIAETVDAFGRLDIVVNNSGMQDVRMLHEYTAEQWDRVMNVNLRSMFIAFREAYPHLRKNRRSYVVNVGSISSFVGQSSTPAYTASKHAVLGLTRSIALDYAVDGVRCNCVAPGITDTPMLRGHLNKTPDPEEALRERLRRVPTGTALTPEDVARSILYFACEDSVGVTGTSVTVDGGYLAAAEWTSPDGTAFMEPAED
jgi:NAD(P)-dependent dehydrogenase (short-subunit alcohol dehydrogenase family)